MKNRDTCRYSSPPDWENMKVLCFECKAIWHCVAKLERQQNAINSVKKAKERGSFLGRRKKRDDGEIRRLRKLGYTMRQIAKNQNISTTAVQRALKDYENEKTT